MGKILELINGSAYKPHPLDVEVPIVERFKGQRLVGCSIGALGMELREIVITKAGIASFGASREVNFADEGSDKAEGFNRKVVTLEEAMKIAGVALAQFSEKVGSRYVVLSVASTFDATLSQTANQEETPEALRQSKDDPAGYCGTTSGTKFGVREYIAVPQKGYRYSMVFSWFKDDLPPYMNMVASAGCELVRVVSGTASILRYLSHNHNEVFEDKNLLILDRNTFFLMGVEGKEWQTSPRFRADSNSQSEALSQMIRNTLKDCARSFKSSTGVVLVNNSFMDPTDFFERIRLESQFDVIEPLAHLESPALAAALFD